MIDRPPSFSKSFMGYHYVIVAVIAFAYFLITWRDWSELLGAVDAETRSLLYVSLAATSGVLLGFGLTAVAVFTGLGSGRGMDFMRGTPGFAYSRVVFMGAIRTFFLSTLVLTALIVLDSHDHPRTWLELLGASVITLGVLRTWALLWLMNLLLDQTLKDARMRHEKKVERLAA
jgi:hypothetical protein